MTKRISKIVDKSLDTNDLKTSLLSIQVSLDGFSFGVYDTISKKFLAHTHYELELSSKTPEKLLNAIETIYEEEALLEQSYGQVVVIHQNNLCCLVPNDYFEEKSMKNYLKHSVKVLPNDFISFDSLQHSPTKTVYIPFVNLNNFFFSKYGSFDFYHSASIFIDRLIDENKNDKGSKMMVNVHKNDFEILVLTKGLISFYNTFTAKTSADFVYYLLFTMEQLNLDPENAETEIFGTLTESSDWFQLAYQYIRKLSFYASDNPSLPTVFNKTPKHSNFALLHLYS